MWELSEKSFKNKWIELGLNETLDRVSRLIVGRQYDGDHCGKGG
jgi:hypothetical protein